MQEYLINEQIRAQSVLLIDENGEKVGIVPIKTAVYRAGEAELDLVCINAKSNPIVCKLMDYSKFKYEQKKRQKENDLKQRQQRQDEKEIQLRPQTAEHDLNVKAKKAREELLDNNKIKVVVSFKGRQLAHPELGFDVLNRFIEKVADVCTIQTPGKLDGRRIDCILVPKK